MLGIARSVVSSPLQVPSRSARKRHSRESRIASMFSEARGDLHVSTRVHIGDREQRPNHPTDILEIISRIILMTYVCKLSHIASGLLSLSGLILASSGCHRLFLGGRAVEKTCNGSIFLLCLIAKPFRYQGTRVSHSQ